LAAGVSEIRYIDDYKNDELVKYFASQKKVKITKI
jgi:deoxycytidylate deaminase